MLDLPRRNYGIGSRRMDHERREPSTGSPGPGPYTAAAEPSGQEPPTDPRPNRELIEHRLGQLEEGVKTTNASVDGLKDTINDLSIRIEKISTGMATKTHIFLTALALAGTLIAGIILKNL